MQLKTQMFLHILCWKHLPRNVPFTLTSKQVYSWMREADANCLSFKSCQLKAPLLGTSFLSSFTNS